MRSSALFVGVVGVVALSACSISTNSDGSITLKTQTRYTEDNVSRTADADWKGESIVIADQGTGIEVNGGLQINFDSTATRVTVNARLLAYADANDKVSADSSIAEAKAGFTIATVDGKTTIACSHGSTHGSSDSGKSGCEKMIVTVPGGTSARLVSVKGLVGNGGIVVNGSGAHIGALALNSAGTGAVEIRADANLGSTISAVTEKAGDVTLHLPSSFSADKIVLVADAASIDTSAFPGLVNNTSRGTVGAGATVISIESKEFAGSTGKIILTN